MARSFASVSLKSPEIWHVTGEAAAPGTPARDCTTPSSTIATAFCGGVFGNASAASWLNAAWPSSLQRQDDDPALLPTLELRLRPADALAR